MKNIFTVLCFSLLLSAPFAWQLKAQTLQSAPFSVTNNIPARSAVFFPGLNKTGTCPTDTINYVFNKSTAFNPLTINNTTSGNAFAQWYPSPQAMTVSGFEFFAWQSTMTSAVVTLTCRMYNSTFDSMPTGTPLATVTVNVDSTFGGGLLSALRKRAIFSTPITTSSPFVLTIESSSATNVAIVANSWLASPPNGRSEWLSSVRIGTTYHRSYTVNVGGPIFNADFIMQPFVSYNITAGFSASSLCNQPGTPLSFTNTSSPVFFNRFYNVRAFFNILQFSCLWDYGDTLGPFYSLDGNHAYNYNLAYRVNLYDTMYGWTTGCGDNYSQMVGPTPTPTLASSNSPTCSGGTVRLFADSIPGVSYYWTGPNGFTSTQRNPVITGASISMIGNYSVVTVMGQCSSTVAQTYVNVVSSYSASNNGPVCVGQALSFNVTAINGATYAWTGPNGFTSTMQNPGMLSATKPDSGQYSVTISLSGCGTLGPFITQAIVNTVPAAPSATNNGPLCVGDNVNLTASGPATGFYAWTGPNNYSSSQQNPVRPSASNTYAGTYQVVVSQNGCVSQPGSTTVIINNIPPSPTAGNNGPLCLAQSLSLSASLISGATYTWSGPNNFSSTQQNPTRSSLSLTDAGTYSVIALVNGCPSPVSTTSVVITTNTPAPTAGSNGPLCPGQSLQLTASSISGATYSWTGPNSFTSTQQNPVINGVGTVNAGIYSVTASTSSCGVSNAASVNLVVNTLPTAPTASNNGPLCDGQTLNLSASTITGATYFWTGPDGFSSSLQNPSISNMNSIKAGQYSVYVSVTGCGTSSTSTTTAISHLVPNTPTAASNSPICSGDTLKLDATGNGQGPNAIFNWTGPNNFNAGLRNPYLSSVNGVNAGTYSVTVTDSGCTSAAGSLTASVKLLPSAPVASSNAPFCEGGNLLLTATNITGATYIWTGPDNYSSNAQNPLLPGAAVKHGGTYLVRSILNGCFSAPASTNVIIFNLPETPVATNNGPKCAGESISLSANQLPGATYSWNGPGGFSSALRNPTIINTTAAMSGKYNVITTADGCSSLEGTTDVVINSVPLPPTLSSNPSGFGCMGDSLMLFASFVGGATYEWTGPAGFGSTLQKPIIKNLSPANSGVYSATVNRAGCISQPGTIAISIYPSPQTSAINGLSVVKAGSIETYSVSGTAGSDFNWIVLGGTQTGGSTTSSITVLWGTKGTPGIVSVTEINPSGCIGKEKLMNVTIGPAAGIRENLFGAGKVRMHPNPAENLVQLEFDYDEPQPLQVSLVDILGKVITELPVAKVDHTTIDLNLAGVPAGIYFVVLQVGDQRGVQRLIVK